MCERTRNRLSLTSEFEASEIAQVTQATKRVLYILRRVECFIWKAVNQARDLLIGTMLLNLFFRNGVVDLWLASVAVLLFSGLLVFDTWRLRNFYGPDEYVGAAVQIYLDLLNMFMAILRVMGNRRN